MLEFLRTGTIDGIAVGADERTVRDALGPPDDVSALRPTTWRYADATEITFHRGEVAMIAVTARETSDAVIKALDDSGMRYEPDAQLTYDDQVAFVIAESGVTLTLDVTRPRARGFAMPRAGARR